MSIILGLMFSIGVFLIYASVTTRPLPTDAAVAVLRDRVRLLMMRAHLARRPSRIFLTAAVTIPLATLTVVLALTRTLPIALVIAAIVTPLPWAWLRRRTAQRAATLNAAWPDVADDLLAAIRSGMALPEAVMQLATRGPEVTREYFILYAREYRSSGRFDDAVAAVQHAVSDHSGNRLCEALRVARAVGGSELGNLLRDLSDVMREDARIRGELLARQSWTVNAARLAVAAPWIVLVLISTRTDAASAYTTVTGMSILAGGAAVCALAYWIMRRIASFTDGVRE